VRCNEAALPHGLVKDVVSVTRVVIETLTVLGRYTSPSVIVSERSKIPQADMQAVKWSLLVADVGSHLTALSACGSRIALSDGECI
jgi:hypothetical protein